MTVPSPTPAELRSAHPVASAVRSAVVLWFAVLGGIGAWTIHLVGLASLVQFTCNAPEYRWLLHALTVVTLAIAGLATWLAYGLLREGHRSRAVDPSAYSPETAEPHGGGGDDHNDTSVARTVFLGRLGVAIGVVNILLITLEEVYVVLFGGVGCG